MTTAARRIVIIGGGTAGWITAGIIAREHPRTALVVLVESPDIPIIGVGEGTWPSMRRTLQRIGLREADLVRHCDASFKQGTEFVGWREDAGTDRYYHPFSLPAEYSTLNLAEYWSAQGGDTSFCDFVTPQSGVIAAARAPKQLSTPEYAFNVNYGYHLDAGRFATVLRGHVTAQANVRHVLANLAAIESLPDGDVAAITLDSGERIAGDLFVDCTGQQSLLIGRHYGVKLKSVRDVLPNDRAIAAQVPYAADPAPIPSTTIATAMPCGWIWDIGLQSRRGVGYVHSSAYVSESDARDALACYIRQLSPGTDTDALGFRTLSFEPGYRLTPWVNNCVAVGLSAGFIEPLEASALAMIEQAACFLGDQLPRERQVIETLAARFNRKMVYHWERIVEFLKLHYVLSRRENSAYWRDCRASDSWPASLAEKMRLWSQQAPWHDDAPRFDELFPSASYQYVLYGMGFEPRHTPRTRQSYHANLSRADAALQDVRKNRSRLNDILPANRELLDAILRGEHDMNTARSA